jgi:acylphosphatase
MYKIILTGDVQGVGCRHYCMLNARRVRLRGSATNLGDGSVRVIIDTDDIHEAEKFKDIILENRNNIPFYGTIVKARLSLYSGTMTGDYNF